MYAHLERATSLIMNLFPISQNRNGKPCLQGLLRKRDTFYHIPPVSPGAKYN